MLRPLIHAMRQLRASPGFAFTAILTLALGIGAPATIYAVLDAVILQPLPFPDADRLVGVAAQPDPETSIPTMQDYLHRSTSFAGMAAYSAQWVPVQDGPAHAHNILVVSQDFFSTLGARFALGQSWPRTANEADCSSEAVVSSAFWNRLGGGSQLNGKSLILDGRNFPIAGVLSGDQPIEGNFGLNHPELFLQVGCDSNEHPNARGDRDYSLIGRLKPGVTISQANADLARVDRTLQKDYPNDYSVLDGFHRPTMVFPYIQLVAGAQTGPTLLLTLAACGLLLLIACANLANLLLARNARRRTEFATRATLGASFSHLLRQLLLEAGILVLLGASGGVALAIVLLNYLKRSTAIQLPRLAHASMRPTVLAFVVLLSAAVTFFLALLPGWRTLRPGLLRDLQTGGRTSAGRSLKLAGRLLVLSQTTLTIVLVACAGWIIGDVWTLLHQPLGFAPEHLLIVRAAYSQDHPSGEDLQRWEVTLKQMAADFRNIPGVEEVAVANHVPLGHFTNRYSFCSDTHMDQCQKQVTISPNSYAISTGYFSALHQKLLEGRAFTASDDGRNHVAIVNQALAAREWPGQSAIGHRVSTGEIYTGKGLTWVTVVGVVGNVHTYDLATQPGPDLYIPRAEDPSEFAFVVVQAKGDPEALKNTVSARLKSAFPQIRLGRLETMSEEMANEVSERRFLMQVAIAFGGVALFLSILGVYGLLAYEVSLREKEIGIRLALGSSRERIVRLLLHEEGRWLVGGAFLGLGCAMLSGYLLRARFYAAHSTTLPVLLGAVLLLLLPALLAIALPASRAALQDPAVTLRRE
jgi:predicted permease